MARRKRASMREGPLADLFRSTGEPGGILATRLHSDGSLVHLLEMPAGGSLMPPSHETVDRRLHTIHMSGNDVFKHAVRAMESVAVEARRAERLGFGRDARLGTDPHQAVALAHQAGFGAAFACGARFGEPGNLLADALTVELPAVIGALEPAFDHAPERERHVAMGAAIDERGGAAV